LKIGVFAYNFEHKKTQEGLINLFLNGYKPECIFAANPVELKFYQSKIRITPKGLRFEHPRKIADKLGISYHVAKHNSEQCVELIKKHDLELGIVLGARILKQPVIQAFKIGIMNMHPGLIPENRGLDNLKWAILKNIRQGVTCHLIDECIDKGRIIIKEAIEVYPDDTLLDIHLRLQSKEQELMLKSLEILSDGDAKLETVPDGETLKAVPPDLERELLTIFEEYKRSYHLLQQGQ
jgi:methionyl-tRNA formyltransferase